MACSKPLTAFRTSFSSKLEFRPSKEAIEELRVPCGQCLGCRLENSRQKAMRAVLEAHMHQENTWLTLTYDDEHLPQGNILVRSDLDKFVKRLRKYAGSDLSILGCGEYGERSGRAHYHLCVFGASFPDQQPFKRGSSGELISRSDDLEKIWTFGQSAIGELNFDTAAYTARYVVKKLRGKKTSDEFVTMSRRPGIGKRFIEKYYKDIYPKDFVHVRGRKMKPPIYFDRWLQENEPDLFEEVQFNRARARIRSMLENQKIGRLEQKEKFLKLRLNQKKETL